MSDSVVLRTYNTRIDAEIDKGYLLSEEIEAVIEADDLGGAKPFPFQPSPTGVLLKVFKEDFAKAKELLDKVYSH